MYCSAHVYCQQADDALAYMANFTLPLESVYPYTSGFSGLVRRKSGEGERRLQDWDGM